jgi:hypothetical protein
MTIRLNYKNRKLNNIIYKILFGGRKIGEKLKWYHIKHFRVIIQ